MIAVLANLSNGKPAGAHCRSRSEHGGLQRVLLGLRNRGLITGDAAITDAGRVAFAEWQKGEEYRRLHAADRARTGKYRKGGAVRGR